MTKQFIFKADCSLSKLESKGPGHYFIRESSDNPYNLTITFYRGNRILKIRCCFAKGQWHSIGAVQPNEIVAPDGDPKKLLDFLQAKFSPSILLSPDDEEASTSPLYEHYLKEENQQLVFNKGGDRALDNEDVGQWLIRESSHESMLTISTIKSIKDEDRKIQSFRCVCINGEWYKQNSLPADIVNRNEPRNPKRESASLLRFLKRLKFEEVNRISPDFAVASTHPYYSQLRITDENHTQTHTVSEIIEPNPHTKHVFNQTVNIDNVNIYQCPKADERFRVTTGSEVTLGDLHANTMKLLFTLVFHGVVHISDENYQALSVIYNKDTHDQEDIEQFMVLLNSMEFVHEDIRTTILIRLIGDELADRGKNDFLTLLLLNKLQAAQVPVKILVSNHSIEFIEGVERLKQKLDSQSTFNSREIIAPRRIFGFYSQRSIFNLSKEMHQGHITHKEVLERYDTVYKPMSCVLSYTLDLENNGITLHSHAPIDIEVIQCLAAKWKLDFNHSTPQALAESIDRINDHYQQFLQADRVHELYDEGAMEAGASSDADISKQDAPFIFIMWNRDYTILDRSAQHHGYYVSYVHGHDHSQLAANENVRNLDNDLGKVDNQTEGCVYTAVCTKNHAFGLANDNESTIRGPAAMGFFRPVEDSSESVPDLRITTGLSQ